MTITGTADPYDFGAVGDGVTDDWQACQDALDTGLPVIASPGVFNCKDRSLHLTTAGQTISSVVPVPMTAFALAYVVANPSLKIAPVFVADRDDGEPLISVEASSARIFNIGAYGTARGKSATAIKCHKPTNADDTDTHVQGACIDEFDIGIHHYNRGFAIEENYLTSINQALRLEWDEANVNYTDWKQAPPFGYRGGRIKNNRVHACSTFIRSTGTAPLRDVQMESNLLDVGGLFMHNDNGMIGGGVKNNTTGLSSVSTCYFNGTSDENKCNVRGVDFIGNAWGGAEGVQYPSHGIWFDTNCGDLHDLLFDDHFSNIGSNGITTGGGYPKNWTIRSRFRNIGVSGGSRACVAFGPNITQVEGLLFEGNNAGGMGNADYVIRFMNPNTVVNGIIRRCPMNYSKTFVSPFVAGANLKLEAA
jgi:hypothetical protein